MKLSLKVIGHPIIAGLVAIFFVQILGIGPVRSEVSVVNPYFQDPPINSATRGVIVCPQTTPAIGWVFECSNSGGSGLILSGITAAPNAPPPAQVAYITNQGAISQTINFPYSGTYTLSFYLAASATVSIEPLLVEVLGHTVPVQTIATGTFTPPSTSSFSQVHLSITVPRAEQVDLRFTNTNTVACAACNANYIYGVAFETSAPFITNWPLDIHPNSPITVEGHTFGELPGTIELSFASPSVVKFTPNGSKTELPLNVEKKNWQGVTDKNTATSEKMVDASPIGAVADGTAVTITVRTADGRVSEGRTAKFHNDAVITKSSSTISSKGIFNLSGWDFGDVASVKIYFQQNPFASPSLDSHLDLQPVTIDWKQWAMSVTMPDVTAIAEQKDVELSFATTDGRKSNTVTAKFLPEIVLAWDGNGTLPTIPPPVVKSCSTNSDFDWCNTLFNSGDCFFQQPTVPNLPGGLSVASVLGSHIGCWGIGSYNGTDSYQASYINGWTIENFVFAPFGLDNGSVNETNNLTPNDNLNITVNWHIGASGGGVFYYGDVYIKGPKGVPPK